MSLARPLAVAVAAVLVVTFLLVPASAQPEAGPFGEILSVRSPDVALSLKLVTGGNVCYIDGDGNGAYNVDDPVVLTTSGGCSGNSKGSDLRLKTWGENQAGRRLGSAADAGKPLSNPTGTVRLYYFDGDGSGRVGAGDTVYVNINNPNSGTVDVGDVRLSPHGDRPAGSVVEAGDADLALTITLIAAASELAGYVDADDDNTFDADESIYINADKGGNELVEFGDLRLVDVDADRPFGSFVVPGDGDGAATMVKVERAPCYVDADGSVSYTPGDPLYLDLSASCTGIVAIGDVRLSASASGAAGTRVRAGDGDLAGNLLAITDARAAYLDNDGDGRFSDGDTFLLDVVAATTNKIDEGDVRITPTGDLGGVVLSGSDVLVGQSLTSLGTFRSLFGFVPAQGGTSPSVSDPLYVNVDGGNNEGVEPNDVRLVGAPGQPFGYNVRLSDGEVLPRITSSATSVCFVSNAASTTYRAGDAVYLALSGGCGATVKTGALRLVATAGKTAGSVVRAADADVGASWTTPSGSTEWKYFDADGSNNFGGGDTLYLDLIALSSNRIDVGDVRLTSMGSLSGGASVAGGDSDNSLGLVLLGAVSGRVSFVDSDGDGIFGGNDFAYVNRDGTGDYVTVLDVRLVPLPPPRPVVVEPEEPTDPTMPTQPTGPTEPTAPTQPTTPTQPTQPTAPTAPSDPADDDDADDDEGGREVRTPGPGAGLIVALLLLGAALRRR